ncbi:hypothetical protein HDU83_000341 [Entophlyctis luteolus]|nr:hypothetical protein HDU83_000341 [Entophlyctis luteolus]
MGPKKTSGAQKKANGKDAAAPPEKRVIAYMVHAALFVPVPGEKLTREQHALLRAQRAKALDDEKKLLFGSWTASGKTPLSVLYEHCQRMDWNKPQVNSASKGAKGVTATITISAVDKKTRATTSFTFSDPDYTRVYATEQEAKHWAATYALHRVASHLSLHRLLPPSHQAYWASLEEIRTAQSPDVQKYDYHADPFAVAELRAQELKAKERETKLENERIAKEADKQAKPWEAYQKVMLSTEMREVVEQLVRNASVVGKKSPKREVAVENSTLVDVLVSKGFRRVHALEALEYNTDLTGAIDWLCIYVPEDDLPESFHSKPTNAISRGQSSMTSLNRERAIEYMSKSGFSREICASEYDAHQAVELDALAALVSKLSLAENAVSGAVAPQACASDSLREELEAIEAIYGTETISRNDRNGMVQLKIDLSMTSSEIYDVVFHVGVSENSKYPAELPAMMVTSSSIPSYMRLSILKKLSSEAVSKWLGSPMVFEMVQWIQDNFCSILENPGVTLMELKQATAGQAAVMEPAPEKLIKPTSKKKALPVETAADISSRGEELRIRYEQQIATKEYKLMLSGRQRLPSYSYREKIIEVHGFPLKVNGKIERFVFLERCGKSTQTGQFILEDVLSSGKGGKCNIICTQPRRISALSLAERVASERAEAVGESIGYSIRGETKRSSQTRLIFATTGILLRMLHGDPALTRVTHVIVDEVHERSVDSDFLLVILKDLLSKRPEFRLVLMSATIDSETFSNYFRGAPVLSIPGFTHPVTDIYLEDFLVESKYVPEARRTARGATRGPPQQQQQQQLQAKDADQSQDVVRSDDVKNELQESYTRMGLEPRAVHWLMRESANNSVDYAMVAAAVKYVCGLGDDGAVLVFLQGAMEIKRCIDVIQSDVGSVYKLELYPLHAQLSPREQSNVFKRPKKGHRKVIVSTNVAETSITIDDVVYVVDSGRVKETRFEDGTLCLVDTLASRAACKQRRGRAGRVRSGLCIKLYTRHLERESMAAHGVPEMLRVPLEQLCLALKAMGVEDVAGFLGRALTPPADANIFAAISVLRELRAVDPESEMLTPLGRHMATIPTDLRVAKMLIFASIFHCIHPVLTIAALLSSKSPFISPPDKRDEARAKRAQFSWDKSDLLTDSRAYDAWLKASASGKLAERDFCDLNFLSMTALVAISDLRRQYADILADIGFIKRENVEAALTGTGECNIYSDDSRIVKAAVAAGLYPQIASVKLPEVSYVETAHGAVEKEAAAHEVTFSTCSDGRVFLHPSSVLSDVGKFEDLFVA